MEWNVFDIFKKAEFNTLIYSAAITGWLLLYLFPDSNYTIIIFGVAILCSVYSIIRIIKLFYNKIKAIIKSRKEKKERELKKRIAAENAEKRKKEQERIAQYVYDRLSQDNKLVLKRIVSIGEKSTNPNAFIIRDSNLYDDLIYPIQNVILYDNVFSHWAQIDQTQDMWCVYLQSPLNKVIEKEIIKK